MWFSSGDVAVESGFDRVLLREGLDPRGQEQIQLLQRKLIQQPAQNFLNLPVRQLQTIHRHAPHTVLLLDLGRERRRPRAARLRGVQHHDEGLADLLQLADDALLGLLIVRARDLRDAPVRRHDDADGRVVGDDLARADLRRLGHGDLVVEPRRHDHARREILKLPHRAGHHIAHAVDQPHGKRRAAVQTDLDGLFGDELRLGGHDGAARAALRQLILRAVAAVGIFDMRDDLRLHETLDKRGFSCPNRTDNADIHAASCPGGHVLINGCGSIHSALLPRCCSQCMRMLAGIEDRPGQNGPGRPFKRSVSVPWGSAFAPAG